MKTTLVAVSGMSPAILTETVWALAKETPPVIPDEVVVITTSRGEDDLVRDLLTVREGWNGKTVWETLRVDLLDRSTSKAALQLSLRVIEIPDAASGVKRKAPDLRTREDNDSAADFIVSVLAPLCDAEDNRVVASIAGGRKTMGALLYAAMSLLGKEDDRVTHVLVGEPYERVRGFFYPNQPEQSLEIPLPDSGGKIVLARDAKIELADIPFVPLRNKFDELNEPRRTFAGLVDCYSRTVRTALRHPPRLALDAASGILSVEDRRLVLAGRDLVVAAFLHRRAREGHPHFTDRGEAVPHLSAFLAEWRKNHPGHPAANRLSGDLSEDDLSKALASLRKKLQAAGLEGAVSYLAPKRGRIGFEIKA